MRPTLRPLPLAALLLLPLAGCMEQSQELLPIPASIKSSSVVRQVEVAVRPGALAKVAALDEQAKARNRSDPSGLPFAEMMPRVIADVTRAWGLTGGRELKLLIEIDAIETAGTAATLFGGSRDRMAGSVFIRDPTTGEPLGQLYVDVVNSHSGPVGLLIRGGGIREELAEEFAIHIARALTGRRDRPR